MREIVLDTETTGLDPYQGHRLLEIGCIELVNRIPSGQVFHRYINPERDIPAEVVAIHGIDGERVRNEPVFAEIVEELVTFLGDATLVAHNAMFDLGFINAELERCGKTLVMRERMVDTLLLARRKHPGGNNRLDDLCVRYRIDNSRRTKHGALLDAELLAEVYVELIDAKQASLVLVEAIEGGERRSGAGAVRQRPVALPPRITAAELAAHRAFVATLGQDPVWSKYRSADDSAVVSLSPAAVLAAAASAPPAAGTG
jgi:DNA polymerase-3 subunit epsilon